MLEEKLTVTVSKFQLWWESLVWHRNAKDTENSVNIFGQAVPGSSTSQKNGLAEGTIQEWLWTDEHESVGGKKKKLIADFRILLPLNTGGCSFNLK